MPMRKNKNSLILKSSFLSGGIRGLPLTSEFEFHRQMDNQIQCLVRLNLRTRPHTHILRTRGRSTDNPNNPHTQGRRPRPHRPRSRPPKAR